MSILEVNGRKPKVDSSAWVAMNAVVIGDVILGARSSVWYGTIIRGDVETIEVGEETNIQDNTVLHTDNNYRLKVHRRVLVGHKVMLHGCEILEGTMVGMGSIILNGAKVGRNCIIGSNALIGEGKEIPDRSLVLGTPGKVIRQVSDEEIVYIQNGIDHYIKQADKHRTSIKVIA